MTITKKQFIDLMNSLPADVYMMNYVDRGLEWDSKKERLIWRGWDDYNDDEGFQSWELKPVTRITLIGHHIYLETDREVNINDVVYPNRKNKSYYLEFTVFMPAKNLNLMVKNVENK